MAKLDFVWIHSVTQRTQIIPTANFIAGFVTNRSLKEYKEDKLLGTRMPKNVRENC